MVVVLEQIVRQQYALHICDKGQQRLWSRCLGQRQVCIGRVIGCTCQVPDSRSMP